MKILLISIKSIHAIRWIENLEGSEHDLYWYDILGRGKLQTIGTVKQILNTSKRKFPYIKGEFLLSKKMPGFYSLISPYLTTTENEVLEKIIREINPDVIHSFEMQSCSYPIIKTMNKFPKIKWIYSCWGNDLYYFQNFKRHKNKIKQILKRVNYLHADCYRDYKIAKELGFEGDFLGVIPTGAGYKLDDFIFFKLPLAQRKVILVKGYQNLFGRGINIIKALEKLKEKTKEFEIIIFGAHAGVQNYISENSLEFTVYGRHDLSHPQIMELMGKSLIYIGNNISDGMANTILEAIIMGAFPIQSNPGNASAEIIEDGVNGLLIEDPENIDLISGLINKAIENQEMMKKAYIVNEKIAREKLEYGVNQQKILNIYRDLQANL